MNAFEINKIVGAVLATALIASVISVAGNILVPEGGSGGGKHEPVAATTGHGGSTATGTGGATAAAKPETPLANLLAEGSAEAGAKATRKCTACHSLNKGGANKIGPNLYGIVGRAKGAHPGYSYSAGMKGAGGTWSYADLYKFLKKPSALVKGTKMSFRIGKPKARADLLLHLRTLSDSPVPLPKPAPVKTGGDKEKKAEAPKETPTPAEAPKKDAMPATGAALAAGDAARGAKLAGTKCKACHSLKAGGPNKIGPNLHGVVGRARASIEGFRYSKAMKAKGGTWSAEELNIFLANPGKFVKGTKMTFKIRKPDQRADIIAYLKSLK